MKHAPGGMPGLAGRRNQPDDAGMDGNRLEIVPLMTNREFLEKYAQPGRVGLAGGASLIDIAIRRAERFVGPEMRDSLWSHAFLFQGRRADGHHWVIESDLDIHRKNIRLGVQENRAEKYQSETEYPILAVLDFGLEEAQANALLGAGLDMVAKRYQYSLRELAGTLVGMTKPALRAARNPLADEKSCFCSAFVRHIFAQIGMDLTPGLHVKHTTPEDISRTPVPHTTWLLRRGGDLKDYGAEIRDRLQRVRRRLPRKG